MAITKVTNPVTDFDKSTNLPGLKIPSGNNTNEPAIVDSIQGMIRNDTEETTGGSDSAITHFNGTAWKYFAATESPIYPTSLKMFLDAGDAASYPGTGTTWFDLTTNQNNGTISGATWNNSGYFDFNGSNNKVTIPSTATTPIDFTQKNYSITAWINPDTSGVNQIITKYGPNDSLRSTSVLINTDNTLRLIQRATGASNNSYSVSTVPQNTWTHIVITRSSSQVKFYLNGTLNSTVGNTFTPNSGGNQPVLIGSNGTTTPTYFNGQISKVRIYDTVLTQTEITALFTEGR